MLFVRAFCTRVYPQLWTCGSLHIRSLGCTKQGKVEITSHHRIKTLQFNEYVRSRTSRQAAVCHHVQVSTSHSSHVAGTSLPCHVCFPDRKSNEKNIGGISQEYTALSTFSSA
jgi:hypothetical protein